MRLVRLFVLYYVIDLCTIQRCFISIIIIIHNSNHITRNKKSMAHLSLLYETKETFGTTRYTFYQRSCTMCSSLYFYYSIERILIRRIQYKISNRGPTIETKYDIVKQDANVVSAKELAKIRGKCNNTLGKAQSQISKRQNPISKII